MKCLWEVMLVMMVSVPAHGQTSDYVAVESPETYVYQDPDKNSSILRRLYVGEVVKPLERLTTKSGQKWVSVSLGTDKIGYVAADRINSASDLPNKLWSQPRVLRNELPTSVGVRYSGETFGAALNMRHMAFTRLGLNFNVGPLIDKGGMRGTAIAGGVVMCAALGNWTPLVEVGATRLSYHESKSTLRVSAFYLTAGLEWMFNNGIFADIGITYVRSMDTELTFEYEEAEDGQVTVGDYGSLAGDDDFTSLQAAKPMFTLGYAF